MFFKLQFKVKRVNHDYSYAGVEAKSLENLDSLKVALKEARAKIKALQLKIRRPTIKIKTFMTLTTLTTLKHNGLLSSNASLMLEETVQGR
jgi:hypothetical protein